MDDGGEGVFGGDVVEYGGEGVAVGGVAGGDGDGGAEGGEFMLEFLCAGGVGAASAEEEKVAGAVLGDEVAGEDGAEGAGGAGDEDGAAVPAGPVGGLVGSLVGGAGQARDEEGVVAEGELGLTAGDRGGGGGDGVGVGVEEGDAAGVLGLGDAEQAPEAGLYGVGVLSFAGGEGAPGDDDEGGVGGAVVGQPGLRGAEGVAQCGVGRFRHVTVWDGRGVQNRSGDVVFGPHGVQVCVSGRSVDRDVADDGPAGGVGGGVGGGQCVPGDAEESVAGGGGGLAQCVLGQGAQQEGFDGGDRGAGCVRHRQGRDVGPGECQPHA